MKQLAKSLTGITLGIFVTFFFFGWLLANVDSYNYYAIGEYFRTGVYPFQEPFVYTRPTTISPPLYGLFVAVFQNIPRSDIPIHAIQLILLGLTSFLLYRLMKPWVFEPAARIISCLFALYPINLIYAGSVMTEIPSQFIVMLWIFLMVKGIKHHDPNPIGQAVLVASLGTLVKYNLGIFVPIALYLFIRYWRKRPNPSLLMPIAGILVLSLWVGVNHTITGTWGLYDTRGTQLYNQFIAQTKLLPPESDPAVRRMRKLLPPGTDIAVYYWDIQKELSERLNRDWLMVDRVLFDVAWASVRSHPFEYVIHSVRNYGLIHYDHVPHWRNIGNMGRADTTGTDRPFCGHLGTVVTCSPIIMTPASYPIWNRMVLIEMKVFENFAAPLFFVLFLPSLITVFLDKNRESRFYGVAYLAGTVPIAFSIHPDPRYIIPFYPLAVLITIMAVQRIYTVRKTAILKQR